MYIKQIGLENFRNYQKTQVEFHKNINIITGNNGQGKTNLIEGLYIMSLGKSFRTNKDIEMIGFGKEFCSVKSVFMKDENELKVEIIITNEGKIIKIDDYKIKRNIEILENVYVVVFSPDDLKIVKDEPEKRRRFIDRELCQIKPVYYKNLARYKKILLQRNHLLKQENIKEDLLLVWNEELASYGSKVIMERKRFIDKLNSISKEISKSITNNKEAMELSYESNVECKESYEEQKSYYLEKLNKSYKKDIYRRTTTVGPHKDDLKISLEGVDIRSFGSQGQQRTAALSLKLAEIKLIQEETREDPILLLDDVLSELDSQRQKFLINSLEKVQVFITTTELSQDLKNSLPSGYLFQVEKGMVKKI